VRPLLVPQPTSLDVTGGRLSLPREAAIVLYGDAVAAGMRGARDLKAALAKYADAAWEIRAAAGDAMTEEVVASIDAAAVPEREGYHLTVGEERVGIVGHDAAGLNYGFQTLVQLVRQYARRLPQLHVEDAPRFPNRGLMLDVSRDRVPTMETLFALVDMIAGWKLNQLQLYTEHTFAYQRHRAVWKDASPLTGEEVLELDAYCRERHVELAPNQQSFGHMTRWLEKKPYNDFAEAPRGSKLPWGRLPPFTLDPQDPRSIALVRNLYDELLPHFTSAQLNVGCDETFELGMGKSKEACEERGVGRVYLEFLRQVHALCTERGRRMMYWGDIIVQHPDLIAETPRDAIALNWGNEHDHPYDTETAAFLDAGVDFYVCPGAGGWNSLIGRLDNAVANISNAVEHGAANGASGVLVTEWGDNGHPQPLSVAWIGIMHAANASWSGGASVDLRAAASLHAFDDPSGVTGRLAWDLGNAYQINGAKTRNGTLPAQLYQLPLESDWPMHRARPHGFDDTADAIAEISGQLDPARMRRADADLIVDELRAAAELAQIGAQVGALKHERHLGAPPSRLRAGWRRGARRLDRAIPEYERVWLARSRPGGLKDSTGRLRAFAAALRAAGS
jgi:hypothetical protein